MALTASNEFKMGTKAPHFNLLNTVTNQFVSLESLKGERGTLIMFICNHCPFVLHVNAALIKLANDYKEKGIHCIAISANDVVAYPQDSPEKMKELAAQLKYPFPYLYDETQEVAKSYDAACTPDFYIFDAALKAIYHGQLDDSRPGNEIRVTGKDLRTSLDHLLANKPVLEKQKLSMGCNIKWK